MAEWYYIGHYGQLGPLTRDQVAELIEGGVITRETYVWKQGRSDWLLADKISELQQSFKLVDPFVAPPPPPSSPPSFAPSLASRPPTTPTVFPQTGFLYPSGLRSDKSRVVAGVLNIIFPGIGRMYLGYSALGALQLIVTIISCGLAILWPLIDGIYILTGGEKLDGYGRQLVN